MTPVKTSRAGFANSAIARGERSRGEIGTQLRGQQKLGFGCQLQQYACSQMGKSQVSVLSR